MAERVVDRLEVVEVHEEHRDRPAVAELAIECVLHPVGEQDAVREAGQRVVQRAALELLLELLALGDVAGVQHDPLHVRIVHQVRADRLDVPDLAALEDDAKLVDAGQPLVLAHRGEERHGRSPVLGGDQVGEPHAFELVRIVAEDARGRRARVLDLGVGLDDHDEVRGVLHERGEPRLALLHQEVLGQRRALERQRHLRGQRLEGLADLARQLAGHAHHEDPAQLVAGEQRRDERGRVLLGRPSGWRPRMVSSIGTW